MILALRPRIVAALLGLLACFQASLNAEMTPEEEVIALEVKAFQGHKAKAEQGDLQAQVYLGTWLQIGKGVAKDESEGMKWIRKAADQGGVLAQGLLGDYYTNGIYVAKDESEGVKWYRKAADQGLSQAQFRLGACYADGRGVVKDFIEAVSWYRKAADQGHVLALFEMGRFYADGLGVSKDEVEAYAFFNLVAGIGFDLAIEKRDNLEKGMPPDARIQGQKRTKELQKEIEAKMKIAAKKAEDAKKSGK
jgi:TPR repeat protein